MATTTVLYRECPMLVRYVWKNGDVILLDIQCDDVIRFFEYLEDTTENKLKFKAQVREAAEQEALRIIREGKKDEKAEAKEFPCPFGKEAARTRTTPKEEPKV